MSKKGHILNMVMSSTLLSLLAHQLHPPAAGEGQRGHQSKEGPKVTVALKWSPNGSFQHLFLLSSDKYMYIMPPHNNTHSKVLCIIR